MKILSKIFQAFGRLFGRRRPMPIVRRVEYGQPDEPRVDPYSPAVEIESSHELISIPGTELQMGMIEKLLETASGGLIRVQQKIGIRFGCGDFGFQAIPEGPIPGLGGQCPHCLNEAMLSLRLGLISAMQVNSLSLYCSNCASRCDSCGRKLCRRHTSQYLDPSGQRILLCPDCLKHMQQDRAFQSALSIVFAPFISHNETNTQSPRRSPDVR
jgi:hypothetical protein